MKTDTARIADMKAEILADIADGTIPTTVSTYSELHDFVDANGYGGFFDEDFDDAHADQFNRASDAIDEWLRNGREG